MKVKDLVKLLLQVDQEKEIVTSGVDCGGYDAIYTEDFTIEVLMTPSHPEWACEKYADFLYVGGIHEFLG